MAGMAAVGTLASKFVGSAAGQAIGKNIGNRSGFYAGAMSPWGRQYRKELKKDVARLKSGDFGLSEGEKQSMLSDASRAARMSTREADEGLRRQAAQMGGFGRSGLSQTAMQGVAKARADAMAGARADIDVGSAKIAAGQRQAALDRIQQQRDWVTSQWAKKKGPTGYDVGVEAFKKNQAARDAAAEQGLVRSEKAAEDV